MVSSVARDSLRKLVERIGEPNATESKSDYACDLERMVLAAATVVLAISHVSSALSLGSAPRCS